VPDGVPPASVPDGAVAGLSLVTWAVLGSWPLLGWRTVAVEAPEGVDDRAPLATLELGTGFEPEDALAPADGLEPANGSRPAGQGAGPSRRSVGLPK